MLARVSMTVMGVTAPGPKLARSASRMGSGGRHGLRFSAARAARHARSGRRRAAAFATPFVARRQAPVVVQ